MEINVLSTKIPEAVLKQIPEVVEKFKIDTPARLSHFLSQCAHESGGFKFVQENLNYSAQGLMGVFKKYFPNEILAKQFERKPNAIANRVYANRMGNGDFNSADGSKFKGRGYIQLTGKDNYSAFDKIVEDNILENPDLVATKYPLLSAAWFWDSRKLNLEADKGASDEVVTAITKKVNGGTHGLPDRLSKFNTFYKLLNEADNKLS
jgi:putative chitinase